MTAKETKVVEDLIAKIEPMRRVTDAVVEVINTMRNKIMDLITRASEPRDNDDLLPQLEALKAELDENQARIAAAVVVGTDAAHEGGGGGQDTGAGG